jgi:hypothetical protein
LTACIYVKVWRTKIDQQIEFESVQRKAITENALNEQVKLIKQQIEIMKDESILDLPEKDQQ